MNGTDMTEPARKLTFEQLLKLEPRLARLRDRLAQHVAANRRKRNWCANTAWYARGRFECGSPKQELTAIVGWHLRPSGNPSPHEQLLRTHEAYDVAYAQLYGMLPDCKACGCM